MSKKQVTPFLIMLTTPMAHIELSCFEKVCSPRNSYDTSRVTIIFFVNSGRTVFSLIYDFEIFQKSANMIQNHGLSLHTKSLNNIKRRICKQNK